MSTKCIPLRPNHWVDSSLPPRVETTVLKGLIIHWYDPQVEGNMICPSFAEATLSIGVSTNQMDNFLPMTPSKLRGLRDSIPTIDGPPFESDESFVLTLAYQDAQGPRCTLMLSRFIFQVLEFVKPAPPKKKDKHLPKPLDLRWQSPNASGHRFGPLDHQPWRRSSESHAASEGTAQQRPWLGEKPHLYTFWSFLTQQWKLNVVLENPGWSNISVLPTIIVQRKMVQNVIQKEIKSTFWFDICQLLEKQHLKVKLIVE